MATLSSMQTANGTCLVRTGLYASGWRIFARDCQGWTAPPGIPANEPTKALADFTRPTTLAVALNQVLFKLDEDKTNLPSKYATKYDNHPRRRG